MNQKEIAAALGVSQSTVSLALSNSPRISEAIKSQVADLASRNGYCPNLNAKALQARKSGLVGILFPEFSQSYYNELKRDLHPLLKARGYTGLFFTAGDDGEASQLVSELQGRGVEGIIAGPGPHSRLKALCLSGFPIVFYRRPEALPCSSVEVDRFEGGLLAGRHLASLGYGSFVCLGADPKRLDERFQGFLAALAEAGLEMGQEGFVPCRQSLDGAYEAMSGLLKRSEAAPRAVFAFNDTVALGAMRAVCDFGLRVPEDVAFVGFDDIQEARFSIPSLSTIAQPRALTAESLVELLFERISGKGSSLRRIVLKTSLVVRESCGAKKKGLKA